MKSSQKHIKRFSILVTSLFCCVAIAIFSFKQCKATNEGEPSVVFVCDSTEIWGIDISHHQRTVQWDLLMKNPPHFIFLKATEGINIKDSTYTKHKAEAEARGILVGAYHFFGYRTPGKEQAKEFIKIADLKKGNLIPVLDVEQRKRMPSKSYILTQIRAYIKAIEQHYGVSPIIYTNSSYYNTYLKGQGFDKYILWIADYRKEPSINWHIWQHTEKHKIEGISRLVDRNVLNGTNLDLKDITLKK